MNIEDQIRQLVKARPVAPALVDKWIIAITLCQFGNRSAFEQIPPCEQAFLLVTVPDFELLYRDGTNKPALQTV